MFKSSSLKEWFISVDPGTTSFSQLSRKLLFCLLGDTAWPLCWYLKWDTFPKTIPYNLSITSFSQQETLKHPISLPALCMPPSLPHAEVESLCSFSSVVSLMTVSFLHSCFHNPNLNFTSFQFLKKNYLFHFVVCECVHGCMYEYHMSAWCLWRSEGCVGLPNTRVPDGCEPLCATSILTAELPLQRQASFQWSAASVRTDFL